MQELSIIDEHSKVNSFTPWHYKYSQPKNYLFFFFYLKKNNNNKFQGGKLKLFKFYKNEFIYYKFEQIILLWICKSIYYVLSLLLILEYIDNIIIITVNFFKQYFINLLLFWNFKFSFNN